jgi:dihydroorotate dehydrogenase (fumarate)
MLKTSVGGVALTSCIYNASGPRTGSIEALMKIAESKAAGAVLSKSATLVEKNGNQLPRFLNKISLGGDYCDGSLNSEGLPNYGIDYCKPKFSFRDCS